ncbi:MAG TPA: TonB-dependent receptor [Bryobacteraceae bacterium]|nr:TonB-dependent receptor [Bryobacteraceae bacterium]
MNGRLAIAVYALLAASLGAQTSATLKGRVQDPSGAAVAGASIWLRNPLSGYEQHAETDAGGGFTITNIPFQDYTLAVEKSGFTASARTVALRSNVPVEIEVRLAVGEVAENIAVTAFETARLVDAEATGTRTQLDMAQIERMPVPAGARALESVLLSFPGFAADANGAIHPRGAHNQMTYVIDGMPISDQLTGAFGNGIDSSIVQTIELYTGNIPAEYGSKISGVANITTRSGLNSGRVFFGSLEATGAQFDHAGTVVQAGGQKGRLGWFASATAQKSNRFLDQVSRDNLHNGGNAERGFARFDYQFGTADFLRVNLMAGRSSFQLANLRSQHAAGQAQRQELGDAAVSVGYIHVIGSAATFESVSSYRTSVAQLFGSPGDTPVTAVQARHLSNVTLANRMNVIRGRHELRFGADYQHFPVSENFSFGITDPRFNPPGAEGFLRTLLAFDLSRGGRLFEFSERASGNLYSGFVQDKIKAGPVMLNLGLRFDRYTFLVNGSQFQPRVGVAYTVPGTGTVLRASYNRLYQTPVNENLLLSNSERSAVLVPPDVRATLGGALIRIPPEKDDVYEVGAQQSVAGRFSLNGMYFRKRIRNLHDNDNFFNTGIIFPTALASARVKGVEGRVVMPEYRGIAGSLSLTHYSVLVTPPFTGGLFLGSGAIDLLSTGPFVIDHDQKLAVHGVVSWRPRRGVWTSASVRYDSGLVTNPSDPDEVRADPDYADLLPWVNLASDPPRVRPRTLVDFMAGYERFVSDRRRWEAVLQVSNVMNRTALYNFQSIFVGTRLVQPRTLGVRLRWYW